MSLQSGAVSAETSGVFRFAVLPKAGILEGSKEKQRKFLETAANSGTGGLGSFKVK